MVIRPVSDAPDGEFGWVCAYDAQGREVLRQKETIGIVFRLEERGVLVGPLSQESDAPVELRVPAGAKRMRVVSQNYFVLEASGRLLGRTDPVLWYCRRNCWKNARHSVR